MDEWDIIAIAFAFVIPIEVLIGFIAAFVKCKKCPHGKDEGYKYAITFLAVVLGMVVAIAFYFLVMLFS